MNQQELRLKSQELFRNELATEEINQHNQEKWLQAVLFLGDKWILSKPIEKLNRKMF